MINGLSSQCYSPTKSQQDEQVRVEEFIHSVPKCIAYFTSSPDEQIQDQQVYSTYSLQSGRISKGTCLFDSEYLLLSDLINFSLKNGYGIIIRMRPRLGSDHRTSQVSTARQEFIRLITSFDSLSTERILLIEPEAQLSSYWLGAYVSLNVFYRSSIGTELSLLGFPVLSPQHLNSFTYQGHYHETATASTTISEWHSQLKTVAQKEFSYYLHLSVRAFFIQRFSSCFMVDLPKLSNDSLHIPSDFQNSPLQISKVEQISSFFSTCSSFNLPTIKGYWQPKDFSDSFRSYMRWLLNSAYPAINIRREIGVQRIRAQFQMFHTILFETPD